ncbi:putative thiamine pyrophosphokinase [Geopyxis carbonaria]|nr:putative thiamine pyrophosphokinase [Geopyxis carbonaria]
MFTDWMSKMVSAKPTTLWDPYRFFERDCSGAEFALLILNQRIEKHDELFAALWHNAAVRVCADGGANRLYDSRNEAERHSWLPDAVIGDLDSLRGDVRKFYEENGVPVIQDPDQDSTDFGKCLKWIGQKKGEKITIVALGGFGGRVDQSFHSIHALHVAQGTGKQIYLVSEQSITFLLEPGMNEMRTPMSALGPTCGIIPVGGPSVITTTGFEWNLDNTETKFGGMVSTSNHLKADRVTVETKAPIVFTVEISKRED